MTIYEIDQEILNCIDEETGEIIDVERLGQLQMAWDSKIEGVACWFKDEQAKAEAIKKEKETLAERQRQCEKRCESLKCYLAENLAGNKFETARTKIGWRKSKHIEVGNIELLPESLVKVKTEKSADKAEIKRLIEAGELVEGASLVENNNIQIK